jgi:undecaprenyl-diphosphatase
MSFLQAIILGIVQGLTEFLPISSTAHLILVQWLLGWQMEPSLQFAVDILLQFGTTVAVIIYFARDLLGMALAVLKGLQRGKPFETAEARLGWLVVLATLPAVVLGLLLKNLVEGLHGQPVAVAIFLMLGSGLIFVVEWIGKRNRGIDQITWRDALFIGVSQALALFPGVSRSAATISGGLVLGFNRPTAARFSFLMSIPVLLGASLVAAKDLADIPNVSAYVPALAVGMVVSGVVGFLSIHWLLGWLAKRSMRVFAWYRIVVGVLCLVFAFLP